MRGRGVRDMRVGRHEKVILLLIVLLIVLDFANKPLCAVCFFGPETDEFIEHPKEYIFEGLVGSEPERREKNIKVTLKTREGNILLFLNRYEDISYGDFISVEGEIVKPEVLGTFNYPAYLLRQGIQGVSYYPKITLIEKHRGSFFWAFLYSIKDWMRTPILEGLGEPHASLILAMTVGDDWRISPEFRELLSRSGTAHISSISGLHMTIIIAISFIIFILIGFSRPIATIATFFFISFYILLVGFPASAIRSGIMGMLLLAAYLLGRLNRFFYSLLLAAFFMLLWDINYFFDVGFQLSFSAMAALALLYQPLRKKFYQLPRLKEHFLFDIFIASLAITIIISPILFYHFGTISVVSPIANMAILPVMPLTMMLAFAAEVTGFFITPLWFALEYNVRVISFFGSI